MQKHYQSIHFSIDRKRAVESEYVYDAWGNHKVLNADGTVNEARSFIGNINPFRYRGYYFDTETNLYYLRSRYYDPETGRFISADNLKILDVGKDHINGLNLYAYCFNNWVNDTDPEGEWSWDKFWKTLAVVVVAVAVVAVVAAATIATGGAALIAVATFAVVNTASQLVSDVINFAATGEWNSGWEEYVGAFVGGMVGGVVFVASGFNLGYTFAAMSGTQALFTDLLTNATGRTDYSVAEILGHTALSAGIGFIGGRVFGGTKVPGVTKGRNSMMAVWKSGLTKLKNGTAITMSTNVMKKGFTGVTTMRLTATGLKTVFDWFMHNSDEMRKKLGLAI